MTGRDWTSIVEHHNQGSGTLTLFPPPERSSGFGAFGEGKQPRLKPLPCSTSGPYVRADVIRELVRPLVDELGIPTVAALAGIWPRMLLRVMSGESECLTAQAADRLITNALDDPSLWWSTPGLELYPRPNGRNG